MIRAARASRFARDESGAALVEFAMLLPIMILFLGMIFEGGRTFWSYQTTVTGVREAARYLSRVAPIDSCATGGDVSAWNAQLSEMIRNSIDGDNLIPTSVELSSVSASMTCTGSGYRGGNVAVATVSATLRIDYPFAAMFALSGFELAPATATIRDSARILGS
ncbi:MAG: TadE/TadG family type IV pilus assembly protein [Sulfitobacter sp.]